MATGDILSGIQLGYQDSAWFSSNPSVILKEGQTVHLLQTGQYKLGDGSSVLSVLSFLGGGATYTAGTGISIISNVISLASSNISQFTNDSGYITSAAISGLVPYTGAALDINLNSKNLTTTGNISNNIFTATNSVTTPFIISYAGIGAGNIALDVNNRQLLNSAGSQINIDFSSGTVSQVGTNFSSDINITGKGTFSGNVNIGNASATNQRILRIGQDTAFMDFGSLVGGTSNPAIYLKQATPSATNFTLTAVAGGTIINDGTGGNAITFQYLNNSLLQLTGSKTSGSNSNFDFIPVSMTNQTASTAISGYRFGIVSRQWATGNISADQKEFYIRGASYSFVGISTISNTYSLYVDVATAGTNATITSPWAIGTLGNVFMGIGSVTNGIKFTGLVGTLANWAIYTDQATPSASNYTFSGTSSQVIMNGASSVLVRIANSTVMNLDANTQQFVPIAKTSGAITSFTFTNPANTNQTASTEIPGFKYNGGSRQYAAGSISLQREFYISSTTYSAVSASTMTNAFGHYVEAPTAGTNVTITNPWAGGYSGNLALVGASAIIRSTTSTLFVDASIGNLSLGSAGNSVIIIGPSKVTINPISSSTGAVNNFSITKPNNTNQTASTSISGWAYLGGSRQWATGAIGTQIENSWGQVTYTAVGASVMTIAIGNDFFAPLASTNMTITNPYSARFNGSTLYIDGSNMEIGSTTGTKIGTSAAQKIGFFNATPVVQQTGGAATAGIAYTSTEQGMLNAVYGMARTIGLLS